MEAKKMVIGIGDRGIGLGRSEVLTLAGEGATVAIVEALAQHFNIPVIRQPGVAQLFEDLELDETIPADLLEVLVILRTELERDFSS